MKWFFLKLSVLRTILSDTNIAIPTFFWLVSAWYKFFHTLILNFSESLWFKCDLNRIYLNSLKQDIYVCTHTTPVNFCLVSRTLSLFLLILIPDIFVFLPFYFVLFICLEPSVFLFSVFTYCCNDYVFFPHFFPF